MRMALAVRAAQAGTYDVVACKAPGANGVNRSWVETATSFDSPPQPEVYDMSRTPSPAWPAARSASAAER